MADPFIAEIRIVPFTFAPKNWALCNGQLLPLTQNTALFALLGTNYGGDGRSNFALPDLQGRVPIGVGLGPGLTERREGESGGSASVALLESEIPQHTHALRAEETLADDNDPSATASLAVSPTVGTFAAAGGPVVSMAPETLAPVGGSQAHSNLQPYLTFHFVIALVGVFPPRP
jgi:microcystin-dependent protein